MPTKTKRKPDVDWPTTPEGWCNWYASLDLAWATTKDSPLHHDKRCPIHRRRAQ